MQLSRQKFIKIKLLALNLRTNYVHKLCTAALRRNQNSPALACSYYCQILTSSSTLFLFPYCLYEKEEGAKPGNFIKINAPPPPPHKKSITTPLLFTFFYTSTTSPSSLSLLLLSLQGHTQHWRYCPDNSRIHLYVQNGTSARVPVPITAQF
jgi:hypothetical protein